MNILFVSCQHRLFDNLDCGASIRSTMFVKALSQIGFVDVISFFEDPVISNIPNCNVVYCKHVDSYRPKNLWSKIQTALKLVFMPWRADIYYHLDENREKVVSEHYSKKKYDFVACRYIAEAVSCGLLQYSDQLIVDVDDNLVNVNRRIWANMESKNILNRINMLLRIHGVGLMSRHFLKEVKYSFYSNILEPPYSKSVYLHNVPISNAQIPEMSENLPMRILTVGWLDHLPNKNGIIQFVKNVYPKIKESVKGVELYIVGKSSDNHLLEYLNGIEGVKTLGFVDDLISQYKEARVVIVPIYSGAGTCVKFVEGLFMNRPIVSTPAGARGFDDLCFDGVHYLQAKDDNDFADKVIYLLRSCDASKKIAANAYKLVYNHFSQERFMEIVKNTVVNSMES